ncbi:MAG: hypothetical protein QW140_02545 [Candidatus Aenigmatarchaeota archaeon]
MKGFVSFIELVTAIIILIVAFTILFPPLNYSSKWGEALSLSKGRDIILSLASSNKMYEYSFNSSLLENFLIQALNETNFIYYYSTENAIKPEIYIACNCTQDEINNLQKWLAGFEINGREINFLIFYSNLNEINDPNKRSDLLLILGNKTLDPFKNEIKKYLEKGNGIILVADPSLEQVSLGGDSVYREIFGLGSASSQNILESNFSNFRKNPDSVKEIIYYPWKFFHKIASPLFPSSYFGPIPVENLAQPSCSNKANGTFQFWVCNINSETKPCYLKFWVCDSLLYIDTDWNGIADKIVSEGNYFQIINIYNSSEYLNFSLNYLRIDKIGISFELDYRFFNFIEDYPVLYPVEGDSGINRILIQASDTTEDGKPVPGVILNSSVGRTAWIADFRKEGVGNDEKLLLASLIFWASNKRGKELFPRMKIGYTTPYLNIENKDVYEVYSFELTLGYPY